MVSLNWIQKTLEILSKSGIQINPKNTAQTMVNKLCKLHNCDSINEYSFKIDETLRCDDQTDAKCDLLKSIESKRVIPVKFKENIVNIVSLDKLDPNGHSCKRCFYKFRIATLLMRIDHVNFQFETNFKKFPNPKKYSLVGLKHIAKNGNNVINSIVVLGMNIENKDYLICRKGNDTFQDIVLIKVIKNNENSLELKEEEKIFKDGTICFFSLDSLVKIDSGKIRIMEENYDEFISEYKKTFSEDDLFSDVRKVVNSKRKQENKPETKKDEQKSLLKKIFYGSLMFLISAYFISKLIKEETRKSENKNKNRIDHDRLEGESESDHDESE